MLKPLGQDVYVHDCVKNIPSELHCDKLKPSLVQNMYIPLCRQNSDPLTRKLSQIESLDANSTISGCAFDNSGGIPKSKLKPVFNKANITPVDNICKSDELKFKLQKLLSLRNYKYTCPDKASKDRNASRRASRKCSVGLKNTELQQYTHLEKVSSNTQMLQLKSCSSCTQKSLKGVETNKSSTQIFSEREGSLRNLEQSNGAKNFEILPNVWKKKRNLSKKIKHKVYNFKISNYTKNMYPGICIGHRHCVESAITVPKNKGWLWNITDEVTGYQPHPTWRPGAVPKSISRIIKNSTLQTQTEVRETFTTQSKEKKIRGRGRNDQCSESWGSEVASGPKPLLHLHEKRDVYCVNIHPLHKDYQNKKDPINFKIRKCSDKEDSSSSNLSLEIDVIVPDEPCVKSNQVKETSEENMKHEEETREDTPKQKNFSCKKKKRTARYVSKQGMKK